VSLLAVKFPLSALPYLMFIGWSLAFIFLVYVLHHRLKARGFSPNWIIVAVAMIALQPKPGEVFFSIAHSQWVLGLALAVYVCLPGPDPTRRTEAIALGIVSLTGPFSAFLIPIIGLQIVFQPELWARWRTYLIVMTGGLIQISLLMTSNRMGSPAVISNDFASWISSVSTFLTFGGANWSVVASALILWALLVFILVQGTINQTKASFFSSDIVYMFIASGLIFAVSLYSVSLWSNVKSISPIGGGSRYYFVPYGLIFVGFILIFRNVPALRVLVVFLVSIISYMSFTPDRRENLQWQAFARFATVHAGVEIPINPRWNFLPIWKVVPPASVVSRTAPSRPVPLDQIRFVSAAGESSAPGNGGTVAEFDTSRMCVGNTSIGLEVEVWRKSPGFVKMQWGITHEFLKPENSLSRFYPAGSVKMQFATQRVSDETFVKLTLTEGAEAVKVLSVTVFCL